MMASAFENRLAHTVRQPARPLSARQSDRRQHDALERQQRRRGQPQPASPPKRTWMSSAMVGLNRDRVERASG
jgi:hypothetical protein